MSTDPPSPATAAARVALLGGGTMGGALLGGWMRSGRDPGQIVVVEKYADRARQLREQFGVSTLEPAEAASFADTLVLAVKPQDVAALLTALAPVLGPDHLVISVAAGLTCAHIEALVHRDTAVVRCMPNTAALVGEAMTAVAGGTRAGERELALAETLMSAIGTVVRVAEAQLDAITALSGSGPAYFFLIVEALIDAGVLLGLPRALATQLVVQTHLGAAVMLRDGDEHPAVLREAVTSPGGTTAEGLRQLEERGVRAALMAAVEAAARRSAQLGAAPTA